MSDKNQKPQEPAKGKQPQKQIREIVIPNERKRPLDESYGNVEPTERARLTPIPPPPKKDKE